MKRKTSTQPTEAHICKQFVKIVRQLQAYKVFPKDFLLVHVANESIADDKYRIHQYRLGLTAGVADYVVFYEGGKVACIEFKRDATCKQSPKQMEFEGRCKDLGIPYLLTWDIHQAVEFLKEL